jgi:hypothetical protein
MVQFHKLYIFIVVFGTQDSPDFFTFYKAKANI